MFGRVSLPDNIVSFPMSYMYVMSRSATVVFCESPDGGIAKR